jgi:hypothetical protein
VVGKLVKKKIGQRQLYKKRNSTQNNKKNIEYTKYKTNTKQETYEDKEDKKHKSSTWKITNISK